MSMLYKNARNVRFVLFRKNSHGPEEMCVTALLLWFAKIHSKAVSWIPTSGHFLLLKAQFGILANT